MKSILVTGATGFLGKHLVQQLTVAEPDSMLRVLARGATHWDGNDRVAVARGDVTSGKDVTKAAEGVSEIYHLAGVVWRNPRKKWLLYQTHIEGARNICEAAREHGVQKIVHVSTSGTIAVSRGPTVHDESSGYKHEIVGAWPYYLSKIFAEKLALTYFTQYQLPVVLVNPSLLLGPGDDRNSSTYDVALFLRGQIMAVPQGGLNFLDVRDAAAGLIAAMRNGRPGERYLLGAPNWSFREFLDCLAKVSGVRAPALQPSLTMSLVSAYLLRRLMPLVGKSFPLDDESIKMAALFWYCDSTKARKELGFQTRDPVETLRDTVDYIRRR